MGQIPSVTGFYPSSLERQCSRHPWHAPKHNKEQQYCKANRTIARMADYDRLETCGQGGSDVDVSQVAGHRHEVS
jgi:hypothetical protein